MISPPQLRAARAMLRIEQTDLAKRSGVSLETIKRLENWREDRDGELRATTTTLSALLRVYEAEGLSFIYGDEPGVKMRRRPVASNAAKKDLGQ